MKTFEFKLESVLTLRTRALESAQQAFAQQQQRVIQLELLLKENHEQLLSYLEGQTTYGQQVDPVAESQRFAYIQFLKSQRDALHQQVTSEKKSLTHFREKLAHAHIEKKSLDVLKDKQEKRHQQWVQTTEIQETDDLMVQRFGRH